MKKYSFWESQRCLLLPAIASFMVSIGICSIYNIWLEYTIYIVTFLVIFWGLAIFCSWRGYKRREQRWEQYCEEEVKRQSAKDLWEAREMVRQQADFFGLWSHQIKTPIAAMNVLFQGAEEDTGAYRQELFRIERYVEMALQYLRFDSMGNDLVLASCELEPLVKQLVKKYAPQFIHRHLSVELENLQQVILTDEKWFVFVLEQILSNAIKYTSTGGIRIEARECVDGIEVGVIDTGIGIRAEDLPRIFEKGYTGYNGRMDKKASGLGLYLCKGICDKLGHGLRAQSVEGKGTEVWILCHRRDMSATDLTKM